MARPMVLVFLLMILVITSQFEWKQQLVNKLEATPITSQKPQLTSNREEVVKEKIILSQEQSIQRLSELVRSFRKQLQECRGGNETVNGAVDKLTENVNEHEKLDMQE